MTAPAAQEDAVAVSGVAKSFGDTRALDDVSFTVRPGELFGFIGPDGAGKTTLFRILTTLILPDAGSARVLGLDVDRDLWAIRASVGYMPGRFSLYPDLTVEENLRFFAAVFGTTIAEGRAIIEPIWRQLSPFATRRADALSGGMKQKLALCCALVHRPRILFLDEPTTGVDAVSRREFWEILAELRATGLTTVVSTPYMDEAGRCDRVALIHGGRILGIAPPGSLGAGFEHALVAVRGANRFALLTLLRGHPDALSVYPFGSELHFTSRRPPVDSPAVAREIAGWLAASGHAGAEVAPIEPGVEDTFMARMNDASAVEEAA